LNAAKWLSLDLLLNLALQVALTGCRVGGYFRQGDFLMIFVFQNKNHLHMLLQKQSAKR
jgi:hypothetical protein